MSEDTWARKVRQFRIPDYLIIPFGVAKWHIEFIKIVAVDTHSTYFESQTPTILIDKKANKPFTFHDFYTTFIGWNHEDVEIGLAEIIRHLKSVTDYRTPYEDKFLESYWQYLIDKIMPSKYADFNKFAPKNNRDWGYVALVPIPQAHLYLRDPLRDKEYTFVPSNMCKVDFAFWTGKKIVAVEIDGSSHIGSDKHVWKDRRLQRAGVEVVHILNGEIDEFGPSIIDRLLPKEIFSWWIGRQDPDLLDF